MQPLPSEVIEKYHEAVKLFKIQKTLTDADEMLLQMPFDFAIETIEWALGTAPLDIDTWQLYILILKDKGRDEALLNVYSRYCRLFVNDQNIRKEYFLKIKQLDESSTMDVIKWWIDYIGIEKHFGSHETALELINMVKSKSSDSWSPRLLKFIKTLTLSTVDIARTSFLNVKIKYTEGLNSHLGWWECRREDI